MRLYAAHSRVDGISGRGRHGASAKRRANPSLAVRVQIHPRPPFERESGKTHSLKEGPDRTSAVHNLGRHDN